MDIKSKRIKGKNFKNNIKFKLKKQFKIYYKSRSILIDLLG